MSYRDLEERRIARLASMQRTHERQSRLVWGGALLLVVAAVALLVSVAVSRSREAKSPVTAPPDSLVLTFGLNRESLTRTFTVDLSQRAGTSADGGSEAPADGREPIVNVRLLSDLRHQGEDAQFPAGQVTVGVNQLTNVRLQVSVTADPWTPERVPPGIYVGTLQVRGTGVAQDIPVWFSLRSRVQPGAWTALVLAFLGAFLGLLVKWITERLTPQAALVGRLAALKRAISFGEDGRGLPVTVRLRVDDLEEAIQRQDYARVDAAFRQLDEEKAALAVVASAFGLLYDLLDGQARLLDQASALSRLDEARLEGAMDAEYRQVLQLRSLAWPEDQQTLNQQLQALRTTFAQVQNVMLEYLRDQSDGYLRDILDRFSRGEFEEGISAFSNWSPVRRPPESVDDPPAADQLTSTSGRRRTPQGLMTSADLRVSFAFRYARVIAGLASVVVVSLVALKTQFLDQQRFTGELSEWLKLGLWGTIVELSGVSVLDVLGRLGGAPSPASTPRG